MGEGHVGRGLGEAGGIGMDRVKCTLHTWKKTRQRKGEGVAQWQSDCWVCVSQYPRLKPQITRKEESLFTYRGH